MEMKAVLLLMLVILAVGCTEETVGKKGIPSPSTQQQALNASAGPGNYLPEDLMTDQLDKSIEELEIIG
ncbi:MAG: hypothetical protein ABIG96_03780 [Candidatus Micrarchaeota archaeon]